MSYDLSVKSLTIRLPDELAERLERESRDRGVSKSDLVRERLSHGAPLQPAERSLMDILEVSWGAKTAARRRRFRSPQKRRIAEAIRAKKLPRR
jgi:predicted transcriptional regulator